jgi:hypothetical protein
VITQTIRVTDVHIRLGTPANCGLCPVALAIQAANPGATLVSVWADTAELVRSFDEPALEADLPQAAQDFVTAFDTPHKWIGPSPVKPFSFEITWLSPAEMAKELAEMAKELAS